MCTWALGELVQPTHSHVPVLIEVYPSVSGSCQCSEGEVRLVNGNFTCGRVEVCIGGAWGTVCDNNFDLADAQVVCQQLEAGPGKSRQEGDEYYLLHGISKWTFFLFAATAALGNATYGQGDASIALTNISCNGSELTLLNCSHSTNVTDYGHDEAASVCCSGVTFHVCILYEPVKIHTGR